ncbi:MAG: DUF2092 domain-containing protein [Rhodobacteraceae bacterium]|nr:DUF2092 domain-containing protein [Paracoccaceae bacterium]
MLSYPRSGLCRTALAGAMSLAALVSPAAADEADARTILAAMSDYLTKQQSFAFDYDATLEVITTEDQRIALASSGTAAVERPNHIHATRRGGFTNVEMGFDGSTFTLVGHDADIYTQIEAPGTIENLIDTLRSEYGIVLPAADLLIADPEKVLMDGVTDVKDLGVGVIGGTDCDHIALRREDVDVQIWVAQGAAPYPCRYVLSARKVAEQPQYSVQISNWTTDVSADALEVGIPDGATKVDVDDLAKSFRELPENFTTGDAQ